MPDSIKSINITKYWLAGFIDGEGTFSTSRYVPRFKLENHVKEFELYNKIKEFLALHNIQANVVLTMPRGGRRNLFRSPARVPRRGN